MFLIPEGLIVTGNCVGPKLGKVGLHLPNLFFGFGLKTTFTDICGCVSLAPNGVRRCLAFASSLRRSHDRGWVVSRCNQATTAQQYLLCGTNRLEAKQASLLSRLGRRDRRTLVVRLSDEPPCDPNHSSIPPVYRLQLVYARRS